MLWLVWQMWVLLALAFAGGVIAGWVLRPLSDAAPERLAIPAAPAAPAPPTAGPASAPAEPEAAGQVAAAFTAPEQTSGEATDSQDPEADAQAGPAASDGDDDLTAIKGLGPKAAAKLAEAGVTRLSQVAAWSESDIERFDALINGRGRIARDDWVGQARALARD